MGRYRRGNKHRKWGNNKSGSGNGTSLTEIDWLLVEKYLLKYRTRAYDIYYSKPTYYDQQDDTTHPVVIGSHQFLALTLEICKQPYIDLPDTLSGRERKRVHALCASINLYHAGVGSTSRDEKATTTNKRRIAISIYADGLKYVPDISIDNEQLQVFPSRKCRPWYYLAYNNGNNSTDYDGHIMQRKQEINSEKKKILQFCNLPEMSLRRPSDIEVMGKSFCDSLDFNVVGSLDLSVEKTLLEVPCMMVDTVDKLKVCVDELTHGVNSTGNGKTTPKIHELAFDLEMCNVGQGNSRSCLIQLTSNAVEKDYIVDPLASDVWYGVSKLLGPLFADPKIVKIGHGIGGMDTTSLHRDFGILVVNAFDTYEASAIISPGKGGLGLANLCRHYKLPSWEYYKDLKHKYQNSDWMKRPLDNDAVEYGRYDIRYLLPLRKLLMRDLAKMDMIGINFLRFKSSLEDDSCFESTTSLQSNQDSPKLQLMDSTISATTEITTTSNLDEQTKDNDIEYKRAPNKSVIHATEFPCYHHLMRAISISQKRCLKLWNGDDKEEPILCNGSLLSMIKQATNGKGYGMYWSDVHTQLYQQLAEWRVETAKREYISGSEVCTIELLVHIAYKLPTSQCELRRYSYLLPTYLEDDELTYCKELFDLVLSSDAYQQQQRPPLIETKSMDVVYYSDGGCKGRTKKLLFCKLLITSSVLGIATLVAMRARAKKR